MAHPGGRPSGYNENIIKKVDKYLKSCQDEEYNWVKSSGKIGQSWEKKIKVKLPTIEGFSLFVDIPLRTIYDWRDAHEEFSQSLSKIVKEQQKRLLEKGLSGDYNPTIAKLILSSNHGMREKTDITTDGKELPTPMYGGQSK